MSRVTHARVLALASALLLTSVMLPAAAHAADTSTDKKEMTYGTFMKMDPAECMKMMDKAHKGYVTKKEFMKFQEQLFNNIPKKSSDRVTSEEWEHQFHTGP